LVLLQVSSDFTTIETLTGPSSLGVGRAC